MKSETLQATDDYSAAKASYPRVSLASMEAKIASELYFTAGQAADALNLPVVAGLHILTICVLTMKNGFTIIGKSAPASPENFDEEKGRRFAYEDAIKQLWPLEGYALRETLSIAGAAEIAPGPSMRQYVGTKIVNAKPMSRAAYNELRGWQLPADENGEDAGYLVEYADGQRPNVDGYCGYVSWSPADVFDRAYR